MAGQRGQGVDGNEDVLLLDLGRGTSPRSSSASPPRATMIFTPVAQGGHHGRLDGVEPVLRLVEDDGRRGFEHLIGDLEGAEAALGGELPPDFGIAVVMAGRQCMNLTAGFPGVPATSPAFTW